MIDHLGVSPVDRARARLERRDQASQLSAYRTAFISDSDGVRTGGR